MQNIKFKIFVVLLLIAGLSYSCSKKKKDEKKASDKKIMTVDAIIAKTQNIDYIFNINGTLLANETVDIRPEISGRVTKIFFNEGTFVNKGKLLVKLNDEDLQAQLKKNTAQLELAEDDESKLKQLLSLNAISKNDYDIANNKLKTLQAEKELLLAQIKKTEIYAPFAGIIGLRYISEGSHVTNATLICKLIQQNPLKLEFSIPDKLFNNIKIGQTIEFIDKVDEKKYQAKIYAIEPAIDETTRTIKIRALYSNSSLLLLPGKFVIINLIPEKPIKNILLPAKSIIPVLDGEMVYSLKNNKVKATIIKTGMRTNQDIEVKEGLQEGDTVITSGLLQLKPGMTVKAKIAKEQQKENQK